MCACVCVWGGGGCVRACVRGCVFAVGLVFEALHASSTVATRVRGVVTPQSDDNDPLTAVQSSAGRDLLVSANQGLITALCAKAAAVHVIRAEP